MSDNNGTRQQLERIEVLLSKSLLGEQFINTQFHIFSARSTAGRVVKPRVLSVNNTLLANGSKYFADLFSSERGLSDPMMVDVLDRDNVPREMDDYEYDSDSDLDEEVLSPPTSFGAEFFNESHPMSVTSPLLRPPSTVPTATSIVDVGDEGAFDDERSDALASDIFLLDQVPPYEPAPMSIASHDSEAEIGSLEIQGSISHSALATQVNHPGVRHILVKDAAFRTWFALLNYLYTGRITFMPLKSSAIQTGRTSELSCSAKSMYRLANRVGLDELRAKALEHISKNLGEHNILRELSSSLLSNHPQLLEVELRVLNRYMNTPTVATQFPSFARCIANKEFAHGADIIIFIASKLLETRSDQAQAAAQRLSMARASPQPLPPSNPAEVVQRLVDKLTMLLGQPPNVKKTDAK